MIVGPNRFGPIFVMVALLVVAGCDSDPADPPSPPCVTDFHVAAEGPQFGILRDTMLFATTGASLRILPGASSFTCADGRIEYITRNPTIIELSGDGFGRTVTAKSPGTTVVVLQARGDKSARDSIVAVVLPPVELAILRGAGQSDTIDAILPDSLVVVVRERDTKRGVRGITVELPGGNAITDANGRVASQLRVGINAGLHRFPIRAFCIGCAGFFRLEDTLSVTHLPGKPHAVSLLSTFPAQGVREYAMIEGQQSTIQLYAFDRRRNPLGPTPATFQATNGIAATISASGEVFARQFGPMTFRVTSPLGEAAGNVRVYPRILVAGSSGLLFGTLTTMYLSGSERRELGKIIVVPGGTDVDWAPDGRSIVFDGAYPGNPGVRHLFIGYPDGNSEPLVPAFRDSVDDTGGRFSPDGQHIYFSRHTRLGGRELWRVRLSDRSVERIGAINSVESDRYPTVSPDGRYVAYIRGSQQSSFGSVMIADISTRQISDTGLNAMHVEWSPVDDRLIIAVPSTGGAIDLNLVDRNGAFYRKLDTIVNTTPQIEGARAWFDWTADGRFILTDFAVIEVETGLRVVTPQDLSRRGWQPN